MWIIITVVLVLIIAVVTSIAVVVIRSIPDALAHGFSDALSEAKKKPAVRAPGASQAMGVGDGIACMCLMFC